LLPDWRDDDTRLFLHFADLSDSSLLARVIADVRPDEICKLAAQSQARASFDVPEYTCDIVALSALRLLEAIRTSGTQTRFHQASSSEMFDSAPPPQNELTPFHPRSPYGVEKPFDHMATVNFRESYGLFARGGILFNHESPRRSETFDTRKIAISAARIKARKEKGIFLGNLDARLDWGYAQEYVEAMRLMLQQDAPRDYVIGTGESHTVREFLTPAFEEAGLDWRELVQVDPRYFRPAEVSDLRADAHKAARNLGWQSKTSFHDLVRLMVRAELDALCSPIGRSPQLRHLESRPVPGHVFYRATTEDFQDPRGLGVRDLADLVAMCAPLGLLRMCRGDFPQCRVGAGGEIVDALQASSQRAPQECQHVGVQDAVHLGILRQAQHCTISLQNPRHAVWPPMGAQQLDRPQDQPARRHFLDERFAHQLGQAVRADPSRRLDFILFPPQPLPSRIHIDARDENEHAVLHAQQSSREQH